MSWLDTVLHKLRDRFSEVIVRPPADQRGVAALRSRFGSLPEDVEYFYSHCSGIVVSILDGSSGKIFSLERSLDRMPVAFDGEPERRFVPIRSDVCGDYDCMVLGEGLGEGAVVFWDHETCDGPAYLLGGSLSSYLEMWADHLVATYLPDGEEDPRYVAPHLKEYPWVGKAELEHPWPFNEEWMTARDAQAAEILKDPATRGWLLHQDNL